MKEFNLEFGNHWIKCNYKENIMTISLSSILNHFKTYIGNKFGGSNTDSVAKIRV